MIRRPVSQLAISNKIKKATNAFQQEHQRDPSAEELSEIISIEIGKIEKAMQTEPHVSSIDAPISDDEETTKEEFLASSPDFAADREVDYESLQCDVMRVLGSVLSERECKIVTQSFGIGCQERGLEDIGHEMGLTRERVRQIRERGLDKIRKNSMSKLLLRHVG